MIYTDMHQQTALDVCPLKANAGWFTGVRITATSTELSMSVWEDNCLSNHPDFAHSASSEPCCPSVCNTLIWDCSHCCSFATV